MGPDAPEARLGAKRLQQGCVYARQLTATADAIGQIRHEVEEFLEGRKVPAWRREEIAIVVTEAVTNVMLHATRRLSLSIISCSAMPSIRERYGSVGESARGRQLDKR